MPYVQTVTANYNFLQDQKFDWVTPAWVLFPELRTTGAYQPTEKASESLSQSAYKMQIP